MNMELPSMDSLRESAGDIAKQATNIVSNPGEAAKSLGETLENAKSSVSGTLGEYSSSASIGLGSASSAFLDSNSLVAKFAFLLLIVIGFMVLFYVGVKLIAYFTSPKSTVVLVSGLAGGTSQLQLSQNPQNSTDVVQRSNNAASGMEFTWSVWLNIASVPNTVQHVFSKGSNQTNSSGLASPNNGPGVYLSSPDGSTVDLNVYMDSVASASCDNIPNIIVSNIPLNKWVHVAVRLQNNVLDTYVNGTISHRYQFANVPKQNYDDVFVGGILGSNQVGFQGYLSNLTYYNRALGVFDINNIIMAGPSLVQSKAVTSRASLGFYTYLSNMWYGANQHNH